MSKFTIEILPTVQLNTLISVCLEDLDSFVWEFDNHTDMVILAVSYQALDGTLGIGSPHEKYVSWFAFLEELFFEKSVHNGVDFVAVFSQFDFGDIYKRLYDLVYITNPLTCNFDGLASERMLGLLLRINEVKGQPWVILGLDQTICLSEVEATDKPGPALIFKT